MAVFQDIKKIREAAETTQALLESAAERDERMVAAILGLSEITRALVVLLSKEFDSEPVGVAPGPITVDPH